MINQLKTFLLLAALTGLVLAIGGAVSQAGLYFAIIFVVIMNFGAYFFSDKIVLSMHRAKEIKREDSKELFHMVEQLAHKAKLPMPKVYIIPSPSPNAFATGRDPKHSAVAFTQGILDLLNKHELEGVAAHELAHIKNRDTLISTIAASIAGVISYIANMHMWSMFFGGRDNNAIQSLLIMLITPLAATLIQMAISRSREYIADATGAQICGRPNSLADALEKLHHGVQHRPMQAGATASLFIVNPLRGQQVMQLFSTHPPMDKRVKKLRDMRI